MRGKFQFIYDAILGLLSNLLIEKINSELYALVLDEMMKGLNIGLLDLTPVTRSENTDYHSDNRFISVDL